MHHLDLPTGWLPGLTVDQAAALERWLHDLGHDPRHQPGTDPACDTEPGGGTMPRERGLA